MRLVMIALQRNTGQTERNIFRRRRFMSLSNILPDDD